MSEGARNPGALRDYAQAHGLTYAERIALPASGDLLGEDDLSVKGAAAGILAGTERGALVYVHYTERSNDTTYDRNRTAAVLRVPESMGFAPYLGSGRMTTAGHLVKTVEIAEGQSIWAAEGINEAWLAELLSPAFTQWLSRSPDEFEWELCDGVLCVSLPGHIRDQDKLKSLCEDAAQIAGRIREECLEEVELGEAKRTAAKPAKRQSSTDKLATAVLDRTTFATAPTDVMSSRPQFHDVVVRHPATYLGSLGMTLAIMLGVNIIGGGIYGLLLNLGSPGRAVLIYQLILFAIIFPLVLRRRINGLSERLSTTGFWREWARERGLTEEEPTTFAATHAKADLPGAPIRVYSGVLGGIEGWLMFTGEGDKRGDVIALVAGEQGPTAAEAFDVSAPGPSATALDAYVDRLATDLRERRGAA